MSAHYNTKTVIKEESFKNLTFGKGNARNGDLCVVHRKNQVILFSKKTSLNILQQPKSLQCSQRNTATAIKRYRYRHL